MSTTADTISGPPVPLPVESFSQRSESRAGRIVRAVLGGAAQHAAEAGDAELSEAFSAKLDAPATGPRATVPAGTIPERFALNQQVESYMQEHGCDFDQALREVAGGGPPAGVDLDREAMNRAVEQEMARSGCDINEAITRVESMAASAAPGTGAPPGTKPDDDVKKERAALDAYLKAHPEATLAEATAAVAKQMKGAS